MTAAYLDSRKLEVNLDGVGWTDITSDVVSSIKGIWGISNNGPLDRVAVPGSLTFELNNVTKKYSPGSASALTGWQKGIALRLTLTFDKTDYVRFYGTIQDIDIQSGTTGTRRAKIRAVDWMDIASTTPILVPQIYTNKRADEGVSLLLSLMPIQPQNTDLAATSDTFDTIFDVIKTKTKALTEFAKLILSEFGYIYLRKDRIYGETLVAEGRHDRDAGIAQSPIPVSIANASHMLMETGDFLLLETGDKILLDETTTYDFDRVMQEADILYGDKFSNFVTVKNYPRLVGGSLEVLFKSNAPISLAAGETKENIRGSYIDPTGGGTNINGTGMVTPVASTDYEMFQNQDGTGTDLTANLSVTADYGTDGVTYTLVNNGATDGFVTLLQARGYPIYVYNPIEQYVKDDTSINQNGYRELVIDQKYSPTLLPNVGLATVMLAQEKDARTILNKIYMLANTSYELMAAFLNWDVGSLIKVVEEQSAINSFYFIQQVNFELTVGGILTFDYLVKDAASLSASYWHLGDTGQSELGVTTVLGF